MDIISSLANHLLIAMPSINEPNFVKTVIYLCEHQRGGSVGLIINRPMPFSLAVVFEQLQIEPLRAEQKYLPLMFGGPVQPERGFVIHKYLGAWRSSLCLQEEVTVTTSNDIIHAIAEDKGPKDLLVALGYAGWLGCQLEKELLANAWLVCPCRSEILYEVPFAERWEYAGSTLGVKMNQLTTYVGHA